MKIFKTVETGTTPFIELNPTGSLLFKGISTPENVRGFYEPVLEWLKKFKDSTPKEVHLRFEMHYMNTVTYRYFYEIITFVKSMSENETKTSFTWAYEKDDDDLKELGEEFQFAAEITFEFVEI